jgi:hypothetical protein
MKPVKSPIITIIVIAASVSLGYYILLKMFILLAPCVQKNSRVFSFDLLIDCINYFYKLILAYLILCLVILLKIKGANILNLKGLIVSRVLVLLTLITFIIMYSFNLL